MWQHATKRVVKQVESVILMNSFQPLLEGKDSEIDYDSGGETDDADEEDDEDPFEDDDPFSNAPPPAENLEHSNPSSYSWCLMRYACIRLAQNVLERFIAVAGIEMSGKREMIFHHSYLMETDVSVPIVRPFLRYPD